MPSFFLKTTAKALSAVTKGQQYSQGELVIYRGPGTLQVGALAWVVRGALVGIRLEGSQGMPCLWQTSGRIYVVSLLPKIPVTQGSVQFVVERCICDVI